ncbi:MAG: sensor histidine kinase [Lachnospiraceae bacterium]|nr:sensor histidine kinase [Lachnospiraceae bacterium]
MKKEKNITSEYYLKLCFWMMGVLNFMIVIFLTLTIVLTQFRIARSQNASDFLAKLMVIPEKPGMRIMIVMGCYLLICLSIYIKGKLSEDFSGEQKNEWLLFLNVFEIILVILLMSTIDMAYNGIIFFVVAEMITHVEKYWSRLAVLFATFLCYLVCSYDLVTLLFPMNSFEIWVSFYSYNTERYFLGMRTACNVASLVLFLIYIVILLVEDRKENERIKSLNDQLQKVNQQLHEYAEEKELMGETRERNRLAREIHDTLGHILTGISVGIDAVMVLMDASPEAAKQQLETIGGIARRGLNDVRRSVRKLKPDALERMSLENAIHQMIEEMSKGTNTKIYFVSYIDKLRFEADEEETLYRIIQESTTNAIRHGKATEIWIRISEKNEELIVMISDNGVGCSEITEGFGLKHMRERVELLNGTLFCESMCGFTVIVKIPIRNSERKGGEEDD